MHDLFTYGTLMCRDIIEALAGPCCEASDAVLRDYRRLAVKNERYPGIIYAEGFTVSGVVYSGIPEEGMRRLDNFEGEMYERTLVEVDLAGGVPKKVFTYVVKDQFRGLLDSEDWNFEEFLETGKEIFKAQLVKAAD